MGGVVGAATGSGAITGAAVGAVAGGALGAAVNPSGNGGATRGYCYTVDQQGNPIVVDMSEVDCKASGGTPSR